MRKFSWRKCGFNGIIKGFYKWDYNGIIKGFNGIIKIYKWDYNGIPF